MATVWRRKRTTRLQIIVFSLRHGIRVSLELNCPLFSRVLPATVTSRSPSRTSFATNQNIAESDRSRSG
jgi:hypothetical protein